MTSSQLRSIHPFPARMAPEIALNELRRLRRQSVVLDPMSGSGTVLRQAVELGHQAIGFDLDPLAVLISRVSLQVAKESEVLLARDAIVTAAQLMDPDGIRLPWIDDDPETKEFVDYWFGATQKRDLRRLAFVLHNLRNDRGTGVKEAVADVLRVALSRIIITKEQCASLARDTSHSRPHKVATESDYEVFDGFVRSAGQICRRLPQAKQGGKARIRTGDARRMPVQAGSVDSVITSPPYLNAIDYMRGHRMALVWLGFSLSELRAIRSSSIGAERAAQTATPENELAINWLREIADLPTRHRGMVDRYIQDVRDMTSEIRRVLKPGGKATLVVGNSCLTGIFIRNSELVKLAAERAGLLLTDETERDLPAQSRYLPISNDGSLGKRMRTETVLTFRAPRRRG